MEESLSRGILGFFQIQSLVLVAKISSLQQPVNRTNEWIELRPKMGYDKVKEKSAMIDPQLLEILACPVCKTDVKLTADENGLKCVQCHRVYPIKDDIPVMLVDEATIDPDKATKA